MAIGFYDPSKERVPTEQDIEQDREVRITNTPIGQEYQWDTLADVRWEMLRHNAACKRNILENPDQFPKADYVAVEQSAFEHDVFLAQHGGGR